ncbi:MAG: 50S ribosomal protein L4 [Acidobacteria bacterium]|nr:50S ribosomal protein L4 [Acidobacteriota bacterium]
MPTIPVRDRNNKRVGEVEVTASVFDRNVKRSLLHEAVVHYRAGQRQGTHKTKGRAEVSGGGRKPWRQKGTGRARVGSIRSPLWRKGGIVFGPQPRDYSYRLGSKKQRHALQMALTVKQRDEQIIVVDNIEIEAPKTKEVAKMLTGLGLEGRVLIYDVSANEELARAARNLPGVTVACGFGLNVYDLLLHDWLLTSREGIERLSEVLA